jgi:uncharacterized repeat protein (TIGR01451 family)
MTWAILAAVAFTAAGVAVAVILAWANRHRPRHLAVARTARRRPLALFLASLVLSPVVALAGLAAAASPAAQAGVPPAGAASTNSGVPPTGSATNVTIGPGAYIIDMGQATQSYATGLRPYGLVYSLIRSLQIPVLWAISNTKARGGVDFTAGGKTYSGGSFVIAPAYAAAAASTIATWRASGVVVDGPLTSSFTIPQFAQLTSWPRIVLDTANGSIAAAFYTNSGIPSAAYRYGTPAQLTPCDDLYVMPHADPTFATHGNLRPFNLAGGAIWGGCHAVSVLENIVDPSLGHIGNFSFLSTNGLVPNGSHGNGSPPYQYDGNPSDPILQFLGSLDAATQNGSEQIYLPSLTSAWRPTTNVLITDPDQQNLVSVAGSKGLSNGPAAVLAYGRGFGSPSNGLVMYEAGHNINTGNNAASVAAQRAFLNFNLLVGIDRAPVVHATASSTVNSGQSIAISSTVSGGTPGYTYQWTSNCAGTFSAATSPSGNWIAPVVTAPTPCILRVVVTDQCGRVNFDAVPLTVQPPPPVGGIIKTAYQNGQQVSSVAAGTTVTYAVSPTSSSPTNPPTDVAITDTASDGQNYVGGSLVKSGAGFTLTPPADGTVLNNTPLATWPSAPNLPSTTSGVAKYLYGQNAQYGQTATVSTSLAYQAASGGGYTPFIVHNTAGDTIVSAINTNATLNNNTNAVTCTDITTNATCNPTPTNLNVGGAGTTSWGNPVVIGTKVYVPYGGSGGNGSILCLDYSNTTPASCTTNVGNTDNPQLVQVGHPPDNINRLAGVWTGSGNLYMLGENGTNLTLGCLTPSTQTNGIGTICTGFPGGGGTGNSNGATVVNYNISGSGNQFVEGVVALGNGNFAFSTLNNSNPANIFGLFCVHITPGTTVAFTNCSGTSPVASLTATTVDARALRPVVTNGTVTGFCYSAFGAATPTGCFDQSGAAITPVPAVPMPASRTVNGNSAIPVPGTSQVVYSTGATADQLQCFDYATNATCGTSAATGQSVYGATFLPNTTCVLSYGATNTVGWKVWDTAKQLASSGPNCVTGTPTYTFSDPAPRYCAPGSGVGDWGNLTLTSAGGAIGTGTVVTYVDTATSAILATVTVTAAMGGGTTTVTIPKPAGVSYATSKNLTVTVQTPSGAPAAGTTITATLANTTTGGALPQLCYQVRVPVCNISVSNQVNSTGGTFTDSGAVGLNCLQPPVLTIVKDPQPATISSAGQTVTYSFVVTNVGGLPASNISVTDTQQPPATQGNLSAVTCPQTTLAQNESMTCTATYTPTQADIDNGAIQDSAVATGTDPQGHTVTSQPFAAVVVATQNPALSITKTSTRSSVAAVGDVIPYTFTVTNSGNITLFDVTAADVQQPPAGSLTTPVSCPATPVLAPGGTFTCTASYTVTQADLDNGNVTDTATASGYTDPNHDPSAPTEDEVLSSPATLAVPVTASPALQLTKSANPTTVSAPGGTITYSYSVTNTGNVTMTGVSIADPHSGLSALTYTWPGAVGVLAPGQVATATATYRVTQADIDAGSIINTAMASGTDPAGGTVNSNPASATVTATSGPALTVQKTANPTSVSAAGQTVMFGFKITNTGNVTLSGVVVNEGTFTGTGTLSTLTYTWPTPSSPGVLGPGQVATATAIYVVTQADVDAGTISNTATGSGTPPRGPPVTSAPSTATVTATPDPALTVVKSAALPNGQPVTVLTLGEVIDYAFLVTNTGNVTLSGVTVADTLFTGSGPPPVISCPGTSLAPGGQLHCTASYTVTQADVDAGVLTNTADATGNPPTGPPVTSPPSTVNAPAVQSPAVAVEKTANPTSVSAAGQTVTFTFTITNTGNVTLHGVVVNEGTFTGTGTLSGLTYTWPGTPGILIPGQQATATATYVVTQADVDAGGFSNTATASGTSPAGVTVTSPPSTVTVTAPPAPSLTVQKTANPTSVTAAGQTVTFTFTITNTGNVTLHGVVVNEGTFSGTGALSGLTYTWPVPGSPGVLAPGQVATATATYTVTQADIDAGSISNTATASGTPPGATTPVTSPPSTVKVTAPPAPALALLKNASPTTVSAVGATITYSYSVTNTGNVTMTGVFISDPHSGLSALTYTWPGAVGVLAPHQQATATATYTVTQADLDAGAVLNTALASGVEPSGGRVSSNPASATVTATQAPALTIQKTANPTSVTAAGQTVTFGFKITNSGNVTLSGVVVNEGTFTGTGTLSSLTYTWPTPASPGILAPGQVATATATYVVTQADIDAGGVSNTATASGTSPGGATVTSPSSTATVTAPPDPALTVFKSATNSSGLPVSVLTVGEIIDYAFVVTNTGNVTLHGITVTDTTFTGSGTPPVISCPVTTAAPGEQLRCTATYTVTLADVNAGQLTNTAVATGTPPSGPAVTSPPSTVVAPALQSPAVTVEKTADPTSVTAAGQTVTFNFTITNTGNVTLHGVVVNEGTFTGTGTLSALTYTWPGTVGVLIPGQQATATATYVVTQADVDAGQISNTATASGTSPAGVTVTSPSSTATVTAPSAPSLTEQKRANPIAVTAAGQTVIFSFTITNTGNVTLHGVVVNEGTFTGSGTLSSLTYTWPTPGAPGVLAPGEMATATASYVVTQTDMDTGVFTNTATASGTPPVGSAVTSPPSTATVTSTPRPSLSIQKTADPLSVSAAGQTVIFGFTITNTGNMTLTGVSVIDGLSGLSGLTFTWPGTPGVLAPGDVATATGSYTVTQADIDAGAILNTATATSVPKGWATSVTSGPASVTVTVTPAPSLTVVKSATGSNGQPVTVLTLGEVINYAFVVTNTGNVTLTDVTVADTAFNGSGTPPVISCPTTTAAPGDQIHCTASYTVTQADVDAGELTNTAVASGLPPGATTPVTSLPSTVDVPAVQSPSLTVDKTADPTSVTAAGDAVTFNFTITNTGNVTLHGVVINEGTFTGTGTLSVLTYTWPGTPGVLIPGQQATATATYTVTQADVDAGSVSNTATTSGTSPGGVTVTSPSSTATVTATPAPDLTVVKSATDSNGLPTTVLILGQVIDYAFVVTNTGNVTLNNITVADTKFTGSGPPPVVSCPATSLAPGDQVHCTATYTITQADVDAGQLTNTATASGTPPGSTTPVTSPPSTVLVPAEQSPSLTVDKTADPTSVSAAGQTVTFNFTITNTGNVTLHGVVVNEDAFTGTGTLPPLSYTWPGTAGVLIPGQQATATVTYTVTQADVDAGGISNTATASGTPPGSTTPVTSPSSTATVTAPPTPDLVITKMANPTSVTTAGQTVTFSFTITNDGNVTMTGVSVTDPLAGLSALTYTWPTPASPGVLAPKEVATATATYTVTQADIDAGSIVNTATASGTPPNSTTPLTSPPSTVTVTASPNPSLTVVKSASDSNGQLITVLTFGQVINYAFVVTNTGNVTLNNITVADTAFNGSGTPPVVSCPSTTAAPGGQIHCTATYTVTQADVDAGVLTNTAVATGIPPGSTTPVTSPPSTVMVPAEQSPSLTVDKTADPTSVSAAGDTVSFNFTITNTGNVTLHGVVVNEGTFTGTGTLSGLTYTWPGTPGVLIPGQQATATVTYVVTQADVDAGTISNTATASGTPPGSTTPVTSPSSTATVTATPAPDLTVVKSASSGGLPVTVLMLGQVIDYSFVVTNTGNVTLNNITVADTAFNGSGTPPVVSCPSTSLAPGDQLHCTATYTVTQTDVDAGQLTNTAVATGTPPGSTTPVSSPPSTVTVPAEQLPSLTVDKTADPTSVTAAGQTVTFNFTIINTGNVTLHGVVVNEIAFTGTGTLSALTYTWPGTPGVLIPGQQATATATYTVTQADVDAGGISNTASASGTPPGATTPVTSPSSTATVTATPAPALTVEKTANPTSVTAAGQTVTFNFKITNTGNVTLHGVTVNEGTFTGTGTLSSLTYTWPTPASPGVLAPKEVATATATYVVTQADVDAGKVSNTATASGIPPGSTTPVTSPSSTATVTAAPAPALTVFKSATSGGQPVTVLTLGQVINYAFVVTNTGNVTLSGITVADTIFTGSGTPPVISCPGTSVAPGGQLHCTASYTVTQADVDAGQLSNTATATGTPPTGPAVTSPPSTVSVPADQLPALTIQKTANPTSVTAAGQTVTFNFTITNTGNVTLHGVVVNEGTFTGSGTLSALSYTWPGTPGVLIPGQQATATATYVATQADIDAGAFSNTAAASGIPPGTTTPVTSPSSTATVTATPAPSLTVVKSATSNGQPVTVLTLGQVIDYAFVVTNTGNVTLHGITVADTAFSGTGTPPVVSCPSTSVAPGGQIRCTATYTVTQADVDAGQLTNTATATGTPPTGPAVTSPPSTVMVPADQLPALTVQKTADPMSVTAAGQTVTFSFTITNTGNVTLSGVVVNEGAFTGTGTLSALTYTWPSPAAPGVLIPGQHATATATYVVTQADINAGAISNTATASGIPPGGTSPVPSPPSTVTVTAPPTPALTIEKTASPTSVSAAGQTVTFHFKITNTGNVTLHGVVVNEGTFTGSGTLSSLTYTWPTPGAPGFLGPGQVATATATYVVTQEDVDVGTFTNTATASGIPPGATSPATSLPSTATVTAAASFGETIQKTADPTSVSAAGQTVTFGFKITNTGNVTLTGVVVNEGTFTGTGALSALTYTWPTPALPGVLEPHQVATATATYVVTQADLDAGKISNTATASGFPPGATSPVTSSPSTVTVTAPPAPALKVVKSATIGGQPVTVLRVGEVIDYAFVVTNTGNVTLTGITVADTNFTGSGTPPVISCPSNSAAPGDQITCTASYTVTQADVDAGHLTNTATASGTPPSGSAITSTPSTVRVPAELLPSLSIDKTADPMSVSAAGQTVTFRFAITNTGNVTLTGVSVADPLSGLSALTYSWPGAPGVLIPGQQATATATYVVTQADVNAGHITNTATVSGIPPGSTTPVTSKPSTVTVTAPPAPALSIEKTADPMSVSAAGQKVTFRFRIKNTGNVTLTGVSVNDHLSGLSTLTYTWPGASGVLTPGQVATATATYVVTQADVDAGSFANTATASGKPPTGSQVTSGQSTVTVEAPPAPALKLVKSASPSGIVAAGNTVTYTFTITNTGNVTLTGVTVHEGDFTGTGALSAITYRWPGPEGVLAPGATATGTATYVATSADMGQTALQNTATVAAHDPRAVLTTSAPSTASTAIESSPSLPFTGADIGRTLVSGVMLLIVGLAMVGVARRRKRE